MKTKLEIAKSWLPRYTGTRIDDIGDYILLTNFHDYVQRFADLFRAEIRGEGRPMQTATNARGLTIIGAANAAVVGVGAWILGVPLVGTIALVTFVTSYVPYLGAFVAGAFAVLIAYGSGGFGIALAMLAIVLLANNTIQNLLEPVAFGSRLRLHPLAVLITVTAGTLLFGVLGAILAAPLTSASVNAYHELREARPAQSSPSEGD